jgi:hypothetical protein
MRFTARLIDAAVGRFGIAIMNGTASAIAISRCLAARASNRARSPSSRVSLARWAKSSALARWLGHSHSRSCNRGMSGAAGFLILS